HQGLHAPVRRQRRRRGGAGPAPALGARRPPRRLRRHHRPRQPRAERPLARRSRDRPGGIRAMIWPVDASIESVWLALYLLSFALHGVFVAYVAAGTGYALVAAVRRSADPIAAR